MSLLIRLHSAFASINLGDGGDLGKRTMSFSPLSLLKNAESLK